MNRVGKSPADWKRELRFYVIGDIVIAVIFFVVSRFH